MRCGFSFSLIISNTAVHLKYLLTYPNEPGAGYPESHPDPQSTSGPKTGSFIIPY